MRILIADDHEIVRRGVRSLLSSVENCDVCGEAVDGQDALEKARELLPDVVIMDVSMPRMNGLESTREITRTLPDTQVIVLSQHVSEEMVRQAFKAGAHGYVVKSSIATELVLALKKVDKREAFLDRALPERIDSTLDPQEILQRSAALEQALRETTTHFQLVADVMAAAVTRCSRDLRYLWVNRRYAEWLRLPTEKIIGRPMVEVLGKEAFERLRHYFDLVLAGDKVAYEAEVNFLGLGRRWVSATYIPTFDSAGLVDGWVGSVVDITDRKRSEDAAIQGHAMLRTAMDAGKLGAWEWDIQQNKVTWTDRVYEFHGLKPGTFAGTVEAFCKLVHPEDLPRVQTAIDASLQGQAPYEIEFRVVQPSGEIRWLSTHSEVLRDRSGAALRMIGMTQDVTDSKKAERATKLLAAIVDDSDDAILSKNLDGIITSWNQGAAKLFGYSAEEVIGRHIGLIVPPDRMEEENRILERTRRGEGTDHFETVRLRKDGTILDVALTISPVKDAVERIVGASTVARNVTERKQAEKALVQRMRQQRALLQLADRLHRAQSPADIYDGALDAIFKALECDRAAVLLYDDENVMRFVNWRGLSENYRRQVEGHPPWQPNEVEPRPTCFNDVSKAGLGESLQQALRNEGIGALAFIPLVSSGRLIGNFVIYFDRPHTFSEVEIEISLVIAQQLAFGVGRQQGEEALRKSEERYRKLAESLDAEVRSRTRELEQRNEQVLRQEEQVRNLSHRLMRVQDEERRRIARELHDGVGQLLAAMTMNTENLATEKSNLRSETARQIDELRASLEQASKEIRTVSYLLHPPLLDEVGLGSALRWYIEGYSERSGIQVTLELSAEVGRLPSDYELSLFRIVQECLTNIHRHAGASSVRVELDRSDNEVRLTVKDNGKGLPAEIQSRLSAGEVPGVGLRGMHERVKQIGGRMGVQSDERGTLVTVALPILSGAAMAGG
jgi:PAS domain S-box-containing protein